MATSGSKSVSVATGLTLKFNWSQSSQSVANNTTTISWNLQVTLASGYSIASSAPKDWSVTVNGKNYSGSNTLPSSGTKTMASGSTTIGHNNDGTKSFSYSFSQEFAITFSGSWVGTKSGSSSGTLETIGRASSVSGGSGTIGGTTTIYVSRASNSYTHTLTYSFGSLSGTIATGVGTSYTWTIPTSFYNQIGSATSGTGTITCTTYNGSTNIGSKSCSFTASVGDANAPSLSVSIVDTDGTTIALTGDSSKLVKYYSDAKVTLTASGKNGASISSYSIKGGGGSSTSSSATINNVTNNKFTCKVTDSRGYATTVTQQPTMVNYVKLTCVMADTKPTAEGSMTVQAKGNYFNGSFGAVSNTLTVQFRYKVQGGSYSGWTTMTNSFSGNTYSSTSTLTGLDYMKIYIFQIRAVDKLATVTTKEIHVKSLPVFDWGEHDFNFNVETNWNFGVDITATTSDGHKRVAFTPCSSAGNTTIGYGSYDEKQGHMNIYGNKLQMFTQTDILIYPNGSSSPSYSLLGAMMAMQNSYALETTGTGATNWTVNGTNCTLIGNQLRLHFYCARSSASATGNITNEAVATFKVKHDGKIKSIFQSCFSNGATGGLASFNMSDMSNDGTYVYFTINLCATDIAITEVGSYVLIPVTINTLAYV